MKFFKFSGQGTNGAQVGAMSDKEVDLLAVMCQLCEPEIIKKCIITRCYAYYVPQNEVDMKTAKEIFAKNGIPMQEHLSRILGVYKQKVLRIDYRDVKNPDKLKQEMKRIKTNFDFMCASGKWLTKKELQKQLQELKQR